MGSSWFDVIAAGYILMRPVDLVIDKCNFVT